ncbi:MAG: bifunctional folylpolyglutamate synthase/dihydrofolate synthase [Dehalococcoidia bacterium]|nr:bifunctional folylpolyglutamate synthase/dihydrofolate synthase [Dehalococcoidia bacterium]MDE0822882.1 bifunctional folylpolyglutamate synthase/dihydrofolate synthase [Dehalococcoidia bacterium]|tara:strand:- start:3072 stop:4412 length:1341 start_codon:yes stop_codon:yes gene_type:complete
MDYLQSISRLINLVDHERNTVTGPRQKAIYDLGRMEALLERLGSPQHQIPAVHIAGTKGKGSTAALCDAALRAAGFSTGFYSSPHLHTFRERIRRDSEPITQEKFAALVEGIWPIHEELKADSVIGPLTLFEYLTGMAFQCFAEDRTDVQVIEVGLGGKLDATNVLDAGVCVITSISLDHTAILGDSIGEIAADKAGIIKPGSTVIIAPQTSEALGPILAACQEKEAAPILVGRDVTWEEGRSGTDGQRFTVRGRNGEYELYMPLLGDHQLENAASAVAALEALASLGIAVNAKAMEVGFEQVSWPCRMEVLSRSPLLVADGAHNVYSVESLLKSLPKYLNFEKLILVTGFSRDKNVEGMAQALREKADSVFATASRHPRSLAPDEVARLFDGPVTTAATASEALQLALDSARPRDLVLVVGSLFLTAEVRESALGIEPEIYSELS